MSKVYLIHERADEKDTAAGAAEKIFRGERIGKFLGIDALALVGDAEDEFRAGVFKRERYLLRGIVLIAVEHSIDGSLAHSHGDVEALVFVEPGFFSQFVCRGLHLRHAVHGGVERKTAPACLRCAQELPTR